MQADFDAPDRDLGLLAPPPRELPAGLRYRLLFNWAVLAGSGVFAFAMLFAIIFVPATDPVGVWRLWRDQRETAGRILGVEKTHFSEGGGDGEEGTPIYRYDYSFEVPDVGPVNGHSYSLGELFPLPANAAALRPPPFVTIEYNPDHPGTSRIKGTRTSPYELWILFILLVPLGALLFVGGGLRVGRRRLQLLRQGELAQGLIRTCSWSEDESTRDLPVAEFKHKVRDLEQRTRAYVPVVTLLKGFFYVWRALAVLIICFGIAVLVFMAGMMLFVIKAPPREMALVFLAIGGFAVVWVGMGYFLLRPANPPARVAPGKLAFKVKCVFEFRLPDGTMVQGKDSAQLQDGAEEPPHPVLYDPDNPRRAYLVERFSPPLQVSQAGDWEAVQTGLPFLRVLIALLLLLGPVLCAVWLARGP